MTDTDLSELLERSADRVDVGPIPLARIRAGAVRRRRRRALVSSLAAAAVMAGVAGGVALLGEPDGRSGRPAPPAATPSGVPTPPGSRLVGIGHAAIAVPESWSTNATRCGTPQKDTVVIDVGAVDTCITPRPRGVDSVELASGSPRFDLTGDRETEVDGVPAQRQDTTCTAYRGVQVCSGTVYLPSLRVSFRAESSTGPGQVDRILGRIRIVPDLVAVPGFQAVDLDHQGQARERYVELLASAGLAADIRTKTVRAAPPGYVLGVAPGPGTMLRPGDTVTVMTVAEPSGPADEVRVSMGTLPPGDSMDYRFLEDDRIRAGATLRVRVGDSIWAFADGKRSGTLAGVLAGTSLAVSAQGTPNYPHSWVAVRPGTTKVTLTITADGEPVVLGVVTVRVR